MLGDKTKQKAKSWGGGEALTVIQARAAKHIQDNDYIEKKEQIVNKLR